MKIFLLVNDCAWRDSWRQWRHAQHWFARVVVSGDVVGSVHFTGITRQYVSSWRSSRLYTCVSPSMFYSFLQCIALSLTVSELLFYIIYLWLMLYSWYVLYINYYYIHSLKPTILTVMYLCMQYVFITQCRDLHGTVL